MTRASKYQQTPIETRPGTSRDSTQPQLPDDESDMEHDRQAATARRAGAPDTSRARCGVVPILRLLVPADRHLRLQQPVMHTLLRLVADAMAVVLMAVTAVVAWVVVQLGGGGVLVASLLAFPACGLLAVAIHHV
ncbi:hypothetical protein ABT255_20445 [Streptomyces mirabilis]|uniref:hypothetical protein n=1 Tax=Streptomyces mirabilis TaxID=68239 RepID=UPI0033338D1B